jgi:hypothetical protein
MLSQWITLTVAAAVAVVYAVSVLAIAVEHDFFLLLLHVLPSYFGTPPGQRRVPILRITNISSLLITPMVLVCPSWGSQKNPLANWTRTKSRES